MPFSNLDYLYDHLPARFRRDDDGLFLKRFLTPIGENLDLWDHLLDTFYQKIDPATAPAEFIDFWLWAFFGWSWYPSWFSLERKRRLFAEFATHLARRGTWWGMEAWLREFSINARVHSRPLYWGEFVFGESAWTITAPLGIVVQVHSVDDEVNNDARGMAWGECVFGEGYLRDTRPTLINREIEDLIRFAWPVGHRLMIEYRTHLPVSGPGAWDSDRPVLDEGIVPDEVGRAVTH